MKEILYLLIYILTEIVNYQLAYTVIFEMNVEKSKKKWIIGMVILLMIHLFVYAGIGSEMSRNISMFSMVIVPICLVSGQLKKRLFIYPIVVMFVGCIATCISFIVSTYVDIPEYKVVESSVLTIMCQCVPIMCMSILAVYRKLRKYEKIQIQLDLRQYVLFYVGIICNFFLLAALQEISEEGVTERMLNYYGMSTSIVCLIMLLMIIWQGITAKRESEYKRQNEIYDMYMKMQEEQIVNIIQQDEKMKSFKHDMNKHFTALSGYAKEGNNVNIQEYLEDINESLALSEVIQYTGNSAIDAVIRQMVEQTKMLGIDLKLNCTSIDTRGISVFDLCTIISNVMKNAIEACEKIELISERKIKILIGKYEEKICIMIKNTVNKPVDIVDGKLKTTKKDIKNHGIGSENVRKTVKKYKGTIEYRNEKGWFNVEIIL